jgi:molybdopterin molybdotransferase
MLDFEAARQRIVALATPLGVARVGLLEAVGRCLAEDVTAPRDQPRRDTSAMDGYAVATRSCEGVGPFRLRVRGESRAGSPLAALHEGAACRIFTGALLPSGADAVVLQENVERDAEYIRFSVAPKLGEHVRPQGQDLREGQIALAKGTRISAFSIGLLASLERQQVLVTARPRVAILCTGDELYATGLQPELQNSASEARIPESNGVALAALCRSVGAEVDLLPPVKDDPEAVRKALEPWFERSDVVFTIGGVSVGDHDRVREGLELASATVDFWKVRIKPGKPLLVARRGACIILGLPGNPVSSQVTFSLFGAPLLRAMQGDARPIPETSCAKLTSAIEQKPGRAGFYRVRLSGEYAEPLSNQSSGSSASVALADGLALVPAESAGMAVGESIRVLRLQDI